MELSMSGHDIVVIGASSGGVEALRKLVGDLPEYLPAALFVVTHFPEGVPSVLPQILTRAGPLRAMHAEDGDAVENGRIYVAPSDVHLLVENGLVRLRRGPRENHHRPAVDALFRTAALAYGPRVVGVVLSGARDDGTAGLLAIKRGGGVAVVQDPDDALFSGMPESALEHVDVDQCLPLDEIAPLLARLAREPAEEEGAYAVPDDMELESKLAGLDPSTIDSSEHPGELSAFSCPDCSGPLYEIRDGDLLRFRCRVGHAYTADSMLDEKAEVLENALYTALNTLEESAAMCDRLAKRSRKYQREYVAARFEKRAREVRQQAAVIRRILTKELPEAPPDAV
jgi:two-component system, chemotaxis family, protein-glutamate methylesterase/glutaminase